MSDSQTETEWGPVRDRALAVATRAVVAGAAQELDELADAVRAVEAVNPQVLVEVGCDRGGTLLAWRFCCPRVYGITLADNGYDTGGSGQPLDPHGAEVFIGDSHSMEAAAWLAAQLAHGFKPTDLLDLVDVLVIDGDHTPDGVRMDLALYGPLVRPGGLIMLHDIAPSEDPRSQVWRVWPQLAGAYQTEEIINPEGGPGWGLIRVRENDEFGPPNPADF
jgi:hypothetical protein